MKTKSNAAKIAVVILLAGAFGLMGWRLVNRPKPSEAVSISAIRDQNGMPVTDWSVSDDNWEYWLPLYGTVRTSGLSEVYASEAEYVTSIPVEVGDMVKKGQVLATLDSKKAAEKVQAAEARYNELAMKYERTRELQKAGGSSRQEVEGVFSQYKDAGASLQSLRTELTRHRVVSPIDGVVLQREAEIGLLANAGKLLFVIGDPRRFEIAIDLSPRYISMIRKGDRARFMNSSGEWEPATVKRVDPMANPVTGLYNVVLDVQIHDPAAGGAQLRVGASVETRILIEQGDHVVVVPYESVRETEGEARVYVCSGDVAVERVVRKGRTNDQGQTRILSGLATGERIVLKGADRMYDGARIWIQGRQGDDAEQVGQTLESDAVFPASPL
ncbi:MAG: efflux RND transporter periplasmic adaptor subunit [Synergistaceae bacterium]|jgi:RND family efflux transporter MFP subunit|nr:efflux RND transporter periplasmic adaptor subunit [Synergistaceae bacterium]